MEHMIVEDVGCVINGDVFLLVLVFSVGCFKVYMTIDMHMCTVKTYMYNILNCLTNTCYCKLLCLCFQLTCIALVWLQDQVDFCADINYLLSVHSTSTIT